MSKGLKTIWFESPSPIKASVITLTLTILIIIITKLGEGSETRYSSAFISAVQRLVKDASRYGVMASQDNLPTIALSNVNASLGYIKAARILLPDREINKLTGIHIEDLYDEMDQLHQEIMADISETCPVIKPDGKSGEISGW